MVSEYPDKEILESTSSVDWQITLQKRTSQGIRQAGVDEAAPEPSARSARDLSAQSSEVVEEIDESVNAADDLKDLESNPSGSITDSKPNEEDFRLKVDDITAHLLE